MFGAFLFEKLLSGCRAAIGMQTVALYSERLPPARCRTASVPRSAACKHGHHQHSQNTSSDNRMATHTRRQRIIYKACSENVIPVRQSVRMRQERLGTIVFMPDLHDANQLKRICMYVCVCVCVCVSAVCAYLAVHYVQQIINVFHVRLVRFS
jgi:hypothetical protein